MKKEFLLLTAFLATKNISEEAFNELDADKKAELFNELNTHNKEVINEMRENGVSKDELGDAVAKLRDSQIEQQNTLNEALKELGLAIKSVSEIKKGDLSLTGEHKSIDEILNDNADAFKAMKEDKSKRVAFKAPATMLISSNVSGGNVPVEQRLPGLNTIASRQVRLLDIVSRGRAQSNTISWVYQANKDGSAGPTAEGAAKNQIDFDLVVANETVKKFTAYIKVSEEMLGDIDFMRTEINNELMRELLKVVESQAYSGDGTGNNMNGIRTVATAFAAGTFANAIDNANAVDVLTVAANQIAIADQEMPNYILMHPSDVTALKMVKVSSTDKRYVERLAIVGGTLSLDGIPILPTTLVTQDTYLIGAFNLATLYEKGELSIEVGRDSDDFTKNLVTILAEWRGLMVVKNNDRTAFVAGTISTDAAALETA